MTNKFEERAPEEDEEEISTPKWLFVALITGFALIIAGMLTVIAAASFGGNASGSAGVVVFIGPFPIVFGVGSDVALLIVIGIILAVISMVFYFKKKVKSGSMLIFFCFFFVFAVVGVEQNKR